LIQKLEALAGSEFDKAYVAAMVKDHEEDVEEFRKASQNATDPGVKAFASKTLPIIEHHLNRIKAIQKEK